MSNIPEDLKYTETHEWVRDDGEGNFTMGITDYAQSEMGELVMLDIAATGEKLSAGDTIGTLEAVKTAEDFYAPMDCTVTDSNAELEDDPELVNRAPYGEGWLVKFTADNEGDFQNLMSAGEYREHIGE